MTVLFPPPLRVPWDLYYTRRYTPGIPLVIVKLVIKSKRIECMKCKEKGSVQACLHRTASLAREGKTNKAKLSRTVSAECLIDGNLLSKIKPLAINLTSS